MNERIKLLAEHAGDDWDHTLESDKEFLKKFAELIVRKCATIADTAEPYKSNDLILKHFGVEEE